MSIEWVPQFCETVRLEGCEGNPATSEAAGLVAGLAAPGGGPDPKMVAAETVNMQDYLGRVDPELRAFVQPLAEYEQRFSPLDAAVVAAYREGYLAAAEPPTGSPTIERHIIDGEGAGETVAIYVINAGKGTARPAILHLHAGGFIIGAPQIDFARLQRMAAELDTVIVSVNYRLAPETQWQGSLGDNYSSLRWLYRNAASLGADPERIAVMGDSAGGGHAALLALVARDRGEVPLIFQCLVYPMIDDRTVLKSYPPYLGVVGWSPEANRFGWSAFLGAEAGAATVPPAVPARWADLAGLPPTWIGVGSLDLFVDENLEYAQRLVLSGVATELVLVPGAFHGFDEVARNARVDLDIVRNFEANKLRALRKALYPEGQPPIIQDR